MLLLSRRSAVDVPVALVQLRSLIVTAPDDLRNELRRLPLGELLRLCSRSAATATAVYASTKNEVVIIPQDSIFFADHLLKGDGSSRR